MQFGKVGKIVAAGTLAGIMMGASVGFAALDSYPQPFISSSGVDDVLIVVGSQASNAAGLASDIAGAIDVAARLGGEKYTETALPGSVSIASVIGEGREVGTPSQQIYLDTHLKTNGLRTALSETDFPTLLNSGTIDTSSEDFDFDLFIDFDNFVTLNYGRPDSNLDPQYFFGEFGTSATTSQFFYRSRVVFTDEVNLTHVATEEMEIFGGTYTWGSTSDLSTTKIVLFGSPDQRLLTEGEEVTSVVGTQTATVKLNGVSDSDTVIITVNGKSESVDKGQTKNVGGVEIFVDDVFFFTKETQPSQAIIGIGATKLTLTDGSQVKATIAGSETTIDGTLVDISTSGGKYTGIDIYIVGQTSQTDFLQIGQEFADPVWKSFKFAFPAVSNPTSANAARDTIEIKPAGAKDADLTFVNDRNDQGTIEFAHIDNSNNLQFGDDNQDPIILVEGTNIDREDFFVLDAGDFSRLFELSSATSLGTADGELTLRDVFSGDSIEVKLGATNVTDKVIDGQTYHFNASAFGSGDDVNLQVTWGDGSTQYSRGDYITVFPALETRRGAKVAVINPSNTPSLAASTAYRLNLPTGAVNVTVGAGQESAVITFPSSTEKGDATAGALLTGSNATIWTSGNGANTAAFQLGRTTTGGAVYNVSLGASGVLTVNLATSSGTAVSTPAVLLVEEEDDNSNQHTLQAVVSKNSDSETTVDTPAYSYAEKTATRPGNTDITRSVDLWGTFAEHDTGGDQDSLTVWYPDEQVFGSLFVLGEGASVSIGGGSGGGTVKSAVPIKTSVARLDTDVTDADKANKNLILVGGPAVNKLVSDLASGASPKTWTLAQWRDGTREKTGILHLISNAFGTGKSALVVAGHSAADTRLVAGVLQNFDAHASELAGKDLAVWKNGAIQPSSA
jgi:hypothetical protein